jgi:hypothetical protein
MVTMRTIPGRPRGIARLTRALGLDRNPLRRASDRAEAWIRVGLLAVFLIAGPMTAGGVGGWAYHAGSSAARIQPAQTSHVKAPVVAPQPVAGGGLAEVSAGSQAWPRSRPPDTAASPRTDEVLAEVVTLALMALVLLAALRLTTALLTRRRLAAWETAWSRVGPQWSGGRP